MKADTPNLGDKYREFLIAAGYSTSAVRQRLRMLARLGKSPDKVSQADIVEFLGAQKLTNASRRVYLGQLRSAFSDMARLGWIPADPTVGVKTAPVPRYSPRPLTPDQIAVLQGGLDGRSWDWSVLGMFAGLRASEAAAVEGRHLERRPAGWTLRIPNGKGGTDLAIPAHDQVVEVVQRYGKAGRLWYVSGHSLSKTWSAAAEDAGLPGLRFHQCRHTFGTTVYRSTRDLLVTQRVMRHASVSTTQVYAQLEDDIQFAAVAGL